MGVAGIMKMQTISVVCFFSLLLCCLQAADADNSVTKVSIITEFIGIAKEQGLITRQVHDKLKDLANQQDDGVVLQQPDLGGAQNGSGVFVRMYNKLTLLNVLYFSGSLLIMGAYSLLMTLAFEHFTQVSLANVIAVQTACFGIVGILIWNTDYQFLGGL